ELITYFFLLPSWRRLSTFRYETRACLTARICYGWSDKSPYPLKSRFIPLRRLFSRRPFFAPSLRRLRSCAFLCLLTLHSYPICESVAWGGMVAYDWRKPWT